FLKRNAETGNDTDLRGKKVVVVGGGNTAMDCCRSARRCGSDDVLVLYRRTEADMPANPIEIHESKIEGVRYEFLAAPIGVYYHQVGADNYPPLQGLKCIRMKAEKKPGSKRSEIVPIEGSEFDLPCDLVLPATGQKIEYSVLNQINEYYQPQSLQLNKWKTLDADETTFQMNIPKVFAAGDAVTGPTNIIQAIAGGRAAAQFMEMFIFGKPFVLPIKPFISTKDCFAAPPKEEFLQRFVPVKRYEMPVLEANERNNFKEVELGYCDTKLAVQEAERCLECGCTSFYHCKLQEYATLYGAVQTRYKGDCQKFAINFQHPQIELDNQKCILCGRCVRVCREYSGNRAWAFFKRGSKTFIAPNLEGKLMESRCDACGLCIDTCPTGALKENYKEKILPRPFEKLPIIDPFGSEGFEVDLLAYKGRIYGATSREGVANRNGLIGREIKFGYPLFNRTDRITQPLLYQNGKLIPITQQQAIEQIHNAVSQCKADENAVVASPTLTNQSLGMIQKWAKEALKTDAIGSFYYLGKSVDFYGDASIKQLEEAKHIYLLGAELSLDHPIVNHLVQNIRFKKQTPVTLITKNRDSLYVHKVDEVIFVDDYNDFMKEWVVTPQSVVMLSDKTIHEIAEKPKSAIIYLRSACNAQGLYHLGYGLPKTYGSKNIFIFGENPIADFPQTAGILKTASFLCVQSLFENETTAIANLVLPMNFAAELGGSFTNTFGVEQTFDAVLPCHFGWNDYQFYSGL
ncbi:MAG: FAD-dependent oxidoreductase, partial [Prevotellaceae bacterium]|nr:FAD-dependent oxidoreductase [Prevotellaceae bacterium]